MHCVEVNEVQEFAVMGGESILLAWKKPYLLPLEVAGPNQMGLSELWKAYLVHMRCAQFKHKAEARDKLIWPRRNSHGVPIQMWLSLPEWSSVSCARNVHQCKPTLCRREQAPWQGNLEVCLP